MASSSCFKKETGDITSYANNGWTFGVLEKLCADCKKEVHGVMTANIGDISPEVRGMPAEESMPAEILGVPSSSEEDVPPEIIGVPAPSKATIPTIPAQVAGTPAAKPTQIYVRQVHGMVEPPAPAAPPKETPWMTGARGNPTATHQRRLSSPEPQRKTPVRHNQYTKPQSEVINSEDLPTEVLLNLFKCNLRE